MTPKVRPTIYESLKNVVPCGVWPHKAQAEHTKRRRKQCGGCLNLYASRAASPLERSDTAN